MQMVDDAYLKSYSKNARYAQDCNNHREEFAIDDLKTLL